MERRAYYENDFEGHERIRCVSYIYAIEFSYVVWKEWKDAAGTLDEYLQFHEWKKVDEDSYYDWKLVQKVSSRQLFCDEFDSYLKQVRRSLRTYRERNDARGVLGVLETCIRTNFAGVESSR